MYSVVKLYSGAINISLLKMLAPLDATDMYTIYLLPKVFASMF